MYVKVFFSGLEGDFTKIGDFTWRVSDCEELVGHPIEHLGRNAINYFMYQWVGPVRCPTPLLIKLFHLIHLNQAFV